MYVRVSGYMGGKKETAAKDVFTKHPTEPLRHAVEGMLPKNRLKKFVAKYLRLYVGTEHPHEAQIGL